MPGFGITAATWQDVPMHSGMTRRGLLRGVIASVSVAGVGLATGCDLIGGSGGTPEDSPHPLDGLLRETVALGDAYDAGIAAVPALATVLTGPRDAHRAHAKALAQAIAAATPKPGVSPTARPSGDRAAVLTGLVAAETKGRDSAREACLSTGARLAPLVGSIAAARACHLEILK
jgi:hypothetical protein